MLYINKDQVEVAQEKRICHVCGERSSTWMAKIRSEDGNGDRGYFCAWCLMYSNQAQWGYDNRDEMLNVGRMALGMAAQHNRPLPAVDERDRLLPPDAERFMMGVSFTSSVMIDRMGMKEP